MPLPRRSDNSRNSDRTDQSASDKSMLVEQTGSSAGSTSCATMAGTVSKSNPPQDCEHPRSGRSKAKLAKIKVLLGVMTYRSRQILSQNAYGYMCIYVNTYKTSLKADKEVGG